MGNLFSHVRLWVVGAFVLVEAVCIGGLVYDTARERGRADATNAINTDRAEKLAQASKTMCVTATDAGTCVREGEIKLRDAARNDEAVIWQRQSASWAWWAVVLSTIQGMVGAAGLIAVLRSLEHSDKALDEARIANFIAKDSTENQIRAWIEIDFHMKIISSVNGNPRLSGTAIIKNGGSTPAIDVTYFIGLSFRDAVFSDIENTITDFVSGALDWSDDMIFANSTISREVSAEHDGAQAKPSILHVYMIAAYKTVFSRKIRITARAWDISAPWHEDGSINFQTPPSLSQLLIATSKFARAKAT